MIDKVLKILDNLDEMRRESKDIYSDIDFRRIEADIAQLIGIKNRNEWTELLIRDPHSKYHFYYSQPLTYR